MSPAHIRGQVPVFAIAVAVMLCACSATEPSLPCPADAPVVRLTPRARTLSVGETFTPTVQTLICAQSRPIPFTGAWSSANPTIATVDSLSGRVTGVKAGTVSVYARHYYYGSISLPDSVSVTVR